MEDAFYADQVSLAIEVLSKWNKGTDLVDKVEVYARFGIPLYLIIDPFNGQCILHKGPNGQGYADTLITKFGDPVVLPKPMDLTLATSTKGLVELGWSTFGARPASGDAAEESQEHGVGGVAVRPELGVRAGADVLEARGEAGEHARSVQAFDVVATLEHVVDHDPGLGQVRRARDVGDHPAGTYRVQCGAEQSALQRAQFGHALRVAPPAGFGAAT